MIPFPHFWSDRSVFARLARRSGALLAFAWLLASPLAAAEEPIPPPPTRWATDTAGFLSEGERVALDTRLEAMQRANGRQILVWIGRTTGDTPVEDWTVRAFEKWKVGRKGIDDGLVIFVFTEMRKVRIEVGYGLEGTVPDAIASRIVNETIAPLLREGQRGAAISSGLDALEQAIARDAGGSAVAPAGGERGGNRSSDPSRAPPRHLGLKEMIIIGILVIGFLILLVTNPSLAIWLLIQVLSSGRGGGGGGGGGGGWSGGGGRSGGGGATGSW
jgi:uncharacterized protein